MADISQLNVNGTTYDIKDSTARSNRIVGQTYGKSFTSSHDRYNYLGRLPISSGVVSYVTMELRIFSNNTVGGQYPVGTVNLDMSSGTSSSTFSIYGYTDMVLSSTASSQYPRIIVTKDTTSGFYYIYLDCSYNYLRYTFNVLSPSSGFTVNSDLTPTATVTGTEIYNSSTDITGKIIYIPKLNNVTTFSDVQDRIKETVGWTGRNLYNKATGKANTIISSNGSETTSSSYSAYNASDFIEVEADTYYYLQNVYGEITQRSGCVYDSSKQFLRIITIDGSGAQSGLINTGANAKYIRLNVPASSVDTCMVSKSSNTNVPYEAYHSDVNTILSTKANDSDVVHKTGAETIAGAKTFSNDATFVEKIKVDIIEPNTASGINLKTDGTATAKYNDKEIQVRDLTTPIRANGELVTTIEGAINSINNQVRITPLYRKPVITSGYFFKVKLTPKTWTGLTNPRGLYIWTDGKNIYHSNGSTSYVLDVATSTWYSTSFNVSFTNTASIWSDGENLYMSNSNGNWQLNYDTQQWATKTWSGLTPTTGSAVWTDGTNIYYSTSSASYMLQNGAWVAKTWTGLTNPVGGNIFTDGDNIYCIINNQESYMLEKGTSNWVAYIDKPYGVEGSGIYHHNGLSLFFGTSSFALANGVWYDLSNSNNVEYEGVHSGEITSGAYNIWTDGVSYYTSIDGQSYEMEVTCYKKPGSTAPY